MTDEYETTMLGRITEERLRQWWTCAPGQEGVRALITEVRFLRKRVPPDVDFTEQCRHPGGCDLFYISPHVPFCAEHEGPALPDFVERWRGLPSALRAMVEAYYSTAASEFSKHEKGEAAEAADACLTWLATASKRAVAVLRAGKSDGDTVTIPLSVAANIKLFSQLKDAGYELGDPSAEKNGNNV